MTDRQKSIHPLHLSFSLSLPFLSFKAKPFACSPLLSLSLLLCSVHVNILFLYICFAPHFWFLHSDCPLPCSNPASLSAPLLSLLFLAPSFLSSSHPLSPPAPFSPSSLLPPLPLFMLFYFVRCHRVLRVPRALLTLSLLPLTV